MPLYEFECGRCGARFEELVGAGTGTVACRACGAAGSRRVYSAAGRPLQLTKTGADLRKQEGKNAELRARAKADFSRARRRAGRRPGGGQ